MSSREPRVSPGTAPPTSPLLGGRLSAVWHPAGPRAGYLVGGLQVGRAWAGRSEGRQDGAGRLWRSLGQPAPAHPTPERLRRLSLGTAPRSTLSRSHRPPGHVAVSIAAAATGRGGNEGCVPDGVAVAAPAPEAGARLRDSAARGGPRWPGREATPSCPPCLQCRRPACSLRAGSATRSPTTPATRMAARSRPFRKLLCQRLIPKSVSSRGSQHTRSSESLLGGLVRCPLPVGARLRPVPCGSCTAAPAARPAARAWRPCGPRPGWGLAPCRAVLTARALRPVRDGLHVRAPCTPAPAAPAQAMADRNVLGVCKTATLSRALPRLCRCSRPRSRLGCSPLLPLFVPKSFPIWPVVPGVCPDVRAQESTGGSCWGLGES